MKRYYVTTPIYYVNDSPHIGSLYTTLAADIIARYYRLTLGKENVFFLTGTDEHGQKIEQSAKEKGLKPLEFADSVVPKFKEAWRLLNINHDYFIRTTDSKHEEVVSKVLQKIYENGYIYEGVYKGLYCVGCEKFLTENDLVDKKCPFHPNREPVYQEEKNYFLKLKELSKEVLKRIKDNDYQILPEDRKNEIVSRIEQGVDDISLSREGVSWGIPVPWDKKQTVYVWVDALWNYYSATQFLENKSNFWPANLHLVGKDILWFHSVIWQALLIAAEIEIPKKIFAHGFFTIDGQKMSKSLGNVIVPKQLVDKYGIDGSRYLVISAVAFGSDGDISLDNFDKKYNADLANGLGNLVSRIAKLCEKSNIEFNFDESIHRSVDKKVGENIEKFEFDSALMSIWAQIKKLDQEINKVEPWKLEGEKLEIFLKNAVRTILYIAYNLRPFLPETANRILKEFKGPKIKFITPLFPRVN